MKSPFCRIGAPPPPPRPPPRPPPAPPRATGVPGCRARHPAAVPHLARLRARLEEPRPRPARPAIVFRDEREAFVGERHAAEAPLGLRELTRLSGERRVERHHLVPERGLVLEIAAVQRLDPDDRVRLIGAPLMIARAGLDAGQCRALTRRYVGELRCGASLARQDLNVLRESVHRDQMRERTLNGRHEHVVAARRRRHVREDRRTAERRLRAGRGVERDELAREVVLEQRVVERSSADFLRTPPAPPCRSSPARSDPWNLGSCGAGPRSRHHLAHERGVVAEPVARIAGGRVRAFGAAHHFEAPCAGSATPPAMGASFVFRNDRCEPSGGNRTLGTRGCGGSVTLVSAPVAMVFSVIA